MSPPQLEFVFALDATVATAIDIGAAPSGFRRVVEIISGSVEGPLVRGTLLPGGTDWQVLRSDGITELHAQYIMRTHDGVLIQVRVRGLRHGRKDALHRIATGEEVDPSEYYFRIAPVYEAPEGPYAWMNRSVFIGVGERSRLAVRLRIFRVL